jgi:DNA repair exonuclease SbcCD ATPase subunit
MASNIITADRKKAPAKKQKQQLDLELAEVRDISDMLFKKLEAKIQAVQALEASMELKKNELNRLLRQSDAVEKKLREGQELANALDRKLAALQQHLQQAEAIQTREDSAGRQQEIVALIRKGLPSREIAEVLDMPQGEVELIAELNRHGIGIFFRGRKFFPPRAGALSRAEWLFSLHSRRAQAVAQVLLNRKAICTKEST